MDATAAAIQERMRGFFPDLLGVKLLEATPERVVAELAVRDDLCTVPGVMHGGAVMAFADTLGAVATVLNLPAGATTTTIESKTNFLSATRSGSTITGECSPLHRGQRTMAWQTRVTAGDKVVALVIQTQMVIEGQKPPEQLMASLFEGKSVDEQKALLATLERAGAALYRVLAAGETDESAREALLAAAAREEENAGTLDAMK
ncbi:MAG: PaaI family thioesterase [Dehalococcoidia bacterium]